MTCKTWFTITNASDAAAAEVSIHDEIGSWGVSARDFLKELRAIASEKPINLSIHSPGGEVFDGLAIYHALKARGNVTVRIEGLAASMASVIAMAGTRIEMPRNAFLMIHNPSGVAMGDAADMRQLADLLDKIKSSLVAAYRDRTKKTDEDIMDMMDAETWLTGEEAVEHGFADATTDEVALSASAFKTARITAALRHAPRALFDTSPPVAPTAALTSTTEHMKALLALANALGISLAENATEADAIAAFKAYKAAPQNIAIDFESDDVKNAFAARIKEATKGHEDEIANLKAELTKVQNLLTNGAAAAAGGNAPVTGVPPVAPKNTMSRSAFNALPHSERNAFMAAGGKLED